MVIVSKQKEESVSAACDSSVLLSQSLEMYIFAHFSYFLNISHSYAPLILCLLGSYACFFAI